jgi:hypothetical protein
MEGDFSRSFNVSRALHRSSVRSLPRGSRGCRCGSGWLDHRFFSRRMLEVEDGRPGTRVRGWPGLFGPTPPLLARSQVSLCDSLCPFVPIYFDLILSFSLLEDLTVTIRYKALIDDDDGSDWPLTSAQPTSPPVFTGSIKLLLWGGVKHTPIGCCPSQAVSTSGSLFGGGLTRKISC